MAIPCLRQDWGKSWNRNPRASSDFHLLEHGLGNLSLAHDDGVCSALEQVIDFVIEMRTCDDFNSPIGTARLLHDLAGLECLRNGHEQPLRPITFAAASRRPSATFP